MGEDRGMSRRVDREVEKDGKEGGEWERKKCRPGKRGPLVRLKNKKHDNLYAAYLIVDVNRSSNLPTAACDRFQPLVIMVTSCCIGVLVVELQSTLGQKSLP